MYNIKGSVLVITIGFILVFTIFGITSIYFSGLQNEAIEKHIGGTQAFWLAEAGIQKGFYKLNYGSDDWNAYDWRVIDSGYESQYPLYLGEGGYSEIQITEYNSYSPKIRSYGYIPFIGDNPNKDAQNYARRIIEIALYRNSFNFGILGKEYITMGGNSRTDSYNSGNGAYGGENAGHNGDVATNGDITINGDEAFIDGDASTGPGGEFADSEQVSGEITHNNNIPFPPVTVPSELLNLASEGQLTSPPDEPITGFHKYSSIKLSNPTDQLKIIGPTHIYLTESSSLSITGPAALVILEGPVIVYTEGDVTISGQGIINTTEIPSNFMLYNTGGSNPSKPAKITLSGQTDFYGAVYAPTAYISITGLSYDIYGAIVGKSLDISGNGTIHYDEKLGDLSYSSSRYTLQNWREIF